MKQVKDSDLINWWLEKFHNTNLEQVKKDHFQWAIAEKEYEGMKNYSDQYSDEQRATISGKLSEATREFYKEYAVTQEQHDEWNKWAQEYTRKITKLPKKLIERGWWSVYLNCSPNIKKENENNEGV